MGNFNDRGGNRGGGFRNGNGGGRPNFKKGGFGGGQRDHQMHKAVCDECGNSCEVPFRPSSDKPIYCDNCFRDKRGNEAPRKEFNDRGPRKDFGNKPNFSKPTNQSNNNDDLKKQLSEMNSKLDRLVSAIEKMQAPKVATPVVVKPAPKVASVVIKKAEVKAAPTKRVAKVPVKKAEVKKAPAKKVSSKKKSK